jgi:hypothetical protein
MIPMPGSKDLIVCRHGDHKVVQMDSSSGEIKRVIAEYTSEGRPLNGPNDVDVDEVRREVYFTDPVYAFLRKDKPADLPYLDQAVKTNGSGVTGVYAASLEGNATVDLVYDGLPRPNGIKILGGNDTRKTRLLVSNCCQGAPDTCTQGTVEWHVLKSQGQLGSPRTTKVEKVVRHDFGNESGDAGCSDGFDMLPPGLPGRDSGELVVASCPRGLCIVDLKQSKMVAYASTKDPKQHKNLIVSNVEFGGNGKVYFTGLGHVSQMPFFGHCQSQESPTHSANTTMPKAEKESDATQASSMSDED